MIFSLHQFTHENKSRIKRSRYSDWKMSAEKLKRKSFTTAEKLKFVREIEDGSSQKDVCTKYGINQTTLSVIYSKKSDLKRRVSDQPSLLKKNCYGHASTRS
jgi:transposase-like protein